MSLVNKETGEPATPLKELQQLNQEKKAELESGLLKEALAISNEKCGALIERQNTLISGLTARVKNLECGNERYVTDLKESNENVTRELRLILRNERDFKDKLSERLNESAIKTASETTAYFKAKADEALTEVKGKLKETENEIENLKTDINFERSFRKFLFFATPLLLIVQTIAIALLLLK